MLGRLRRAVILYIVKSAERGDRWAQWIARRETRKMLSEMPKQSPIVTGAFRIPDPNRALPDDDDDDDTFGEEALVSLPMRTVTAADLTGQTVHDMSTMIGSYGMGSYGFFGLMLDTGWMIIPLTDAVEWLTLDGRRLAGELDAWIVEGDDRALLARLQGAVITQADLERAGLTLRFDNGAVLAVTGPGRGSERAFLPEDNLAAALILSPSGEVYL